MKTVESLSYINDAGLRKYTVEVFDDETRESLIINLPEGKYDKSTIVNALVRSKYTQDHVEAIINNHFLSISEWLDAKLSGSTESFSDPDYNELQAWRAESKRLADEIIKFINN